MQIHETIETINQLKTQREFMLSFARDPQGFINDWLQSQCRDLKVSPFVMRHVFKRLVDPYLDRWHVSFANHCHHSGPICHVSHSVRENVSLMKIQGHCLSVYKSLCVQFTQFVFNQSVHSVCFHEDFMPSTFVYHPPPQVRFVLCYLKNK